jgi:hypothetical protein
MATSPLTVVQTSSAQCALPKVWTTEIPDGTAVRIKIAPDLGNGSNFSMNPYRYVKSPSAAASAFQDMNGTLFDNVLRYSCYETRKRGMTIRSKREIITASTSGAQTLMVHAGKFCVTKADGSSTGDSQTCDPAATQVSAQSYYYNLYIPDSRRGEINSSNEGYLCPKVTEALRSPRGTTTSPDYWPLDSQFALSITRTGEFKIGVESRSLLGTGDTSSVSTACATSSTPNANANGAAAQPQTSGIVKKCLGYAMKPATNGTCAPIQLADGSIRPTYRLRRYVAIYPPFFDSDGKLLQEPQRTDVIYVLDRPVFKNGVDPRQPYTMRGPKPCPFAYFDHMGVTADRVDPDYVDAANPSDIRRRPGYVSTNNTAWNGVNVDGIQFPNIDVRTLNSGGVVVNSCAAAIPKLNWDSLYFSIVTPHSSQNPIYPEIHVRPGKAWAPHYEEDTAFEACAPQASPFWDPPLHFARDNSSGNISWCSEAYPSQNPDIHNLDRGKNAANKALPGLVLNYTSHVVKNSSSNVCSASVIDMSKVTPSPFNYPQPGAASGTACTPTTAADGDLILGVAYHPNGMTVDRTVSFDGATCSNGGQIGSFAATSCYYCANQTCDRTVSNSIPHIAVELSRYPLLARATQVESAISSDSTYGCTITYDAGGGKTGKNTPTNGCCGSTVKMDTGTQVNTTARSWNMEAHLEPDVPCQMPTY